MAKLTISARGKNRVESGHPWVFASDIAQTSTDLMPGDVTDVIAPDGRFLGRGYYNPKSQISLRMLTREDEPVDRSFVERKVNDAIAYRKTLGVLPTCRLIHAESDFLPALVVDKFGSVLVLQSLSLGMEKLKAFAVDPLMAIPGVRGIYERNDVPVRTLEGLEQSKGVLCGEFDTTSTIEENGIRIAVDIVNGQKTGYFLDQRENRAAIAPFVRGKRVLDCFCHIGSFALHAARFGAVEAVGVDVSKEATDRAVLHADLNGLGNRCSFVTANAFDYLRDQQNERANWDVVILDPPAFAKNKSALKNATRGYKDINLRAMKLLPPGGILVTCSCSYHMALPLFLEMLTDAARDAGRALRIIEVRGQAKDHPSLLAAPETNYLKCVIAQVW